MKKISIALIFAISLNTFANCIPDYQAEINKKSISRTKLNKAGKITTLSTFGAVGGFFGTMGVILVGPWWAFAAIGGPFGLVAALPVGSTFYIISKIQKNKIKKKIEILNLISNNPEVLEKYYHFALIHNPQLTLEKFNLVISDLNQKRIFCDGSLSHRSNKLALPKDVQKYLQNITI